MPMCAFFPWYTLDRNVCFAEFALAPVGNRAPAITVPAAMQGEFARILNSFESGGAPIGGATIIRFADLGWNSDLDDMRRADLFVFSELLAMSGIAAREYFNFSGYQNRDNFQLFIQQYGTGAAGVMITSRRRDGHGNQYWSAGRHAALKPDHVNLDPNHIDEPLLNALVQSRRDEHWPRRFDAIVNFNLANTDRSDVAQHLETVLTISAFERLLDCKSNEDHVAAAVTNALEPSSTIPASASTLLTAPAHAGLARRPALRDAWIRDFFRLRGSMAHGNIMQAYQSAWSAQAHLLLGSFAFPLALKRVLNGQRLYEWTESDLEMLDRFERLLCEELFDVPESDSAPAPWWRIETESKKQRRIAQAVAAIGEGTTTGKKPAQPE